MTKKLFFCIYLRNDFNCNFGKEIWHAVSAEEAKEKFLAPLPKSRRRAEEKRICKIIAHPEMQA